MHQVVLFVTTIWLLISVRGSVEPLHRTRSPACERHIGRLAMQDILSLRDLFQLWTQNKRIEMDMEDLLEKIREPPTDAEEAYTWKTHWSPEYIEERMKNATNTLKDIDAELITLITRLKDSNMLSPDTGVQDLVHCSQAHLNPHLFPDQPEVSFMLQYFKRPRNIEVFVQRIQACSRLVPTEFLVNVDNPDEGQIWADLSYSTAGLIVPVMSYNVHELRAYNRLASLARGRILVLLQDDDVINPADCSWLPRLVAQFDAMPQLAMVGMNNLQLGHGEGNDKGAHGWLKCPKTGNNMIFAFQVDLAPIAVRRSAFKAVGGLDEGMSDRGECGIWSDWELSIRMWVAGWRVAWMPLIQKATDGTGEAGGTHKPETGARCWGRQQGLGGALYMSRWGTGRGGHPGMFLDKVENVVRLANLRDLVATFPVGTCPFRKGCSRDDSNPPMPVQYNYSYKPDTELNNIVDV